MELIIPRQALNAIRSLGLNIASDWSLRVQERSITLLLIWEECDDENKQIISNLRQQGNERLNRVRQQDCLNPGYTQHVQRSPNKVYPQAANLSTTTQVPTAVVLEKKVPLLSTPNARPSHKGTKQRRYHEKKKEAASKHFSNQGAQTPQPPRATRKHQAVTKAKDTLTTTVVSAINYNPETGATISRRSNSRHGAT
ncbi:hypothetical protein ACJMK2_003993 [Sinanodonta woodiana]|uniref:Uncharacterized protein n=1 Tax=Sinanodonta woodiana TaxID=1069815 RepID=A0ABD3XZV2_SINWO